MSVKKGKSAAQQLSSTVKKYGVPFYSADVDLEQDFEALNACADAVAESVKDQGVLILTGGLDKFMCVAVVPDSKKDKVTAADWVNATMAVCKTPAAEGATENRASAEYTCNKDAGEFPIKMVDTAKAASLAFLRSKGQVEDESDDDDEPAFRFDD